MLPCLHHSGGVTLSVRWRDLYRFVGTGLLFIYCIIKEDYSLGIYLSSDGIRSSQGPHKLNLTQDVADGLLLDLSMPTCLLHFLATSPGYWGSR